MLLRRLSIQIHLKLSITQISQNNKVKSLPRNSLKFKFVKTKHDKHDSVESGQKKSGWKCSQSKLACLHFKPWQISKDPKYELAGPFGTMPQKPWTVLWSSSTEGKCAPLQAEDSGELWTLKETFLSLQTNYYVRVTLEFLYLNSFNTYIQSLNLFLVWGWLHSN